MYDFFYNAIIGLAKVSFIYLGWIGFMVILSYIYTSIKESERGYANHKDGFGIFILGIIPTLIAVNLAITWVGSLWTLLYIFIVVKITYFIIDHIPSRIQNHFYKRRRR